jgi:hypothetical protein
MEEVIGSSVVWRGISTAKLAIIVTNVINCTVATTVEYMRTRQYSITAHLSRLGML